MSQRQALHQLLDELPESDLATAARVLGALHATSDDPLIRALEQAPFDDEPDDDDFDGGLSEARRAADTGSGITTRELRRELGLG